MAHLEPSLLNNTISTKVSHAGFAISTKVSRAGLSIIWWPFPLTLFILMDYPIYIDTISME